MAPLQKTVFTLEDLPHVRGFYCGDEPWEKEVARWIRNLDSEESVSKDMRERGTQVWLYWNEDNHVVGFSSLGVSNWRYPEPSSKRVAVNLIPYVGIRERFQGEPKDAPPDERYSAQILDDLIFEATKHTERYPVLTLFVDPRNTKAIHVYEKAGFVIYSQPSAHDGFYRMTLDLPIQQEDNEACRAK